MAPLWFIVSDNQPVALVYMGFLWQVVQSKAPVIVVGMWLDTLA
jgi:hypothetical protein